MRAFFTERRSPSGSRDVRSLLRYAIREMYGIPLPAIDKTEAGKPLFPDRPEIHFSLSHSKRHVMCAVGDAPVGADIEEERPLSRRLVERYSTPEELSQFEFLELWVLKESRLKLMGGTLPGLRSVHFKGGRTGSSAPIPARPPGCGCRRRVCTPRCAAWALRRKGWSMPAGRKFIAPIENSLYLVYNCGNDRDPAAAVKRSGRCPMRRQMAAPFRRRERDALPVKNGNK